MTARVQQWAVTFISHSEGCETCQRLIRDAIDLARSMGRPDASLTEAPHGVNVVHAVLVVEEAIERTA